MGNTARDCSADFPVPKVVFIGSKRYVKYGISPLKLAELKAHERPSAAKQEPIMVDGYEYVYNSHGKLVRLEHIDPQTTDEFFLTPDAQLTEEQKQQLEDSAERPLSFDEDCPETTPEQLERFRRFGQERNRRRAEMKQIHTGE